MKLEEARKRREEIVARRAAGEAMESIAADLVITRQRVKQILDSITNPRNNCRKFTRSRLTRGAVARMVRDLTGAPRTIFLRITEHDWSLTFSRYQDSEEVGTYTRDISIDDLHSDVEFKAAEMARRFWRSAA